MIYGIISQVDDATTRAYFKKVHFYACKKSETG